MLAAAGRQGRDGRAEGIIFQFHPSWALAQSGHSHGHLRGFPVPRRVELSPFTSATRGPGDLAAFQGMVLLSGASNW